MGPDLQQLTLAEAETLSAPFLLVFANSLCISTPHRRGSTESSTLPSSHFSQVLFSLLSKVLIPFPFGSPWGESGSFSLRASSHPRKGRAARVGYGWEAKALKWVLSY